MKRQFLFPLLLSILSFSPMLYAQNSGGKSLDIGLITSGYFSPASAGYGFRPYVEGDFYTVLSPDRAAILKCSYQTGETVDTLFCTSKARECSFKTIDNYLVSPTAKHILLLRETEAIYRRSRKYKAFVYDVRRNQVDSLTTDSKIRIPLFSPDGRQCAYVKEDNNIYIKNFDYKSEQQLTTDGRVNAILNGVTDWVYEEELTVTSLMQWSTDSKILAYVKTDESKVPSYNMQIWGNANYPRDYWYKYPKAGEANSSVSLHAYFVNDKLTRDIPLPIEGEFYISRLDYAFDKFQVFTLNRNQNHFRLLSVNPKAKTVTELFAERSDTYVDNEHLRSLSFGKDAFYYVSEAGDYAVLNAYSRTGQRLKALSPTNLDLSSFYGATNTKVYYAIAAPTPADRQIWVTDTKTGKTRSLSPEKGYNTAIFSSNFSYYLLSHSSANEVPVYSLNASDTGKKLVLLEDNATLKEKLKQYQLPRKQFIDITTADGQLLKAYLIEPRKQPGKQKYPALFVQYSGPNSQQVQNRFSIDWQYLLAQQGIAVVCVDGRGTAARGVKFRKSTYKQMGLLEAQDQCAAAKAFAASRDDIDPSKLAIWGWSFGGYTTLMAMCSPEQVFAAGIAIAPPTDWRYYDTIYSERYMQTPAENPEGYKSTSVVERVPQFKGQLLLVQGTADDNVHLQNSISFIKAMVKHDKYYEMLIYPDKNHSIYGGNTRKHLFTMQLRFLQRVLQD